MKSVAGGQGFGHLRIYGCSVDPASAPSCLSILIPVPTKTTTKPKGLVAVFVAGGVGISWNHIANRLNLIFIIVALKFVYRFY